MALVDKRAVLDRLMRQTLEDSAHWTYRAVRPCAVPQTWHPSQPIVADCSKGVEFLCRWAEIPDPMHGSYGPWGNSATLAACLPHLGSTAALAIGDIVTFGPGGSSHAAMVLEPAPDPLLWSFGHQGAPNTYRLSEDSREYQLLRLPDPVPPPSPEVALRKMTGYWAWLKWSLGEGEWRDYGGSAKGVRPNVPRRIPAAWWVQRKRFLLARKKGNDANG